MCPPVLAEADSVQIYVAPEGDDSAAGTITAPLKSLAGVQKKVRELAGDTQVEVIFRGGEYRFDKSVSFTAEDSGTEANPVIYRSMDGEEVVFKASKSFSGSSMARVTDEAVLERLYEKVRNKIVVYDLAKEGFSMGEIKDVTNIKATAHKFSGGELNKLYVNDVEQRIAEWPNGAGYYSTWDYAEGGRTIHFNDNEPTRWTKAKDWWLGGFQDFDFRYSRVSGVSVDPIKNTLTVANLNSDFNFTSYQSRRWKAFNLLEEIDLPGEYYIDRQNMLLYLYPPYSMQNASLELSVMGVPFVDITGTSHITFKGISFTQNRDDAVRMKDVRNIDFIGCIFEDISGMGIYVTGSQKALTDANYWQVSQIDGSYDCDIRDCIFRNIGSSAIEISGGNVDTLEKSNNVIDNNIFYMCSQIVKNYNAVTLYGCGNTFTHNNISRCAFQGVYFRGNDHTVKYNEIYDVIQETDDCGAIYCGRNLIQQGTEIAYNYLHDLYSTDRLPFGHQTAIYWDDGIVGQSAHHNIIRDVRINVYTNGIGNDFSNNTSINLAYKSMDIKNGGPTANRTDGKNGFGSVIANPQLYYSRYPNLEEIIKMMANGNVPELSKFSVAVGNLDVNAPEHIIGTYTMEHGTVKNNLNISGLDDFVDPENQDYRLKSGSETAKKMPNILNESFDIEQIGLQSNEVDFNAETSPFKLLYPANGEQAVPASEIEFKWEDSFGAGKYRLVIATDKELKNVVYDEIADYNVKSVEGLEKGRIYYWKVYAQNRSREIAAEWESTGPVYTFSTAYYEKLSTEYFDKAVSTAQENAQGIEEGTEPGQYPEGTRSELESLINKSYVIANSRLGMFTQKTFDNLSKNIVEFFQKKGMVNPGAINFGEYAADQSVWGGDAEFVDDALVLKSDPTRTASYSMAGTLGLERMTGSVVYCFDAKIELPSKFVIFGLSKAIDAPQYTQANAGYSLVIKPDCIELQYSTGTEHGIFLSVPHTLDDQFHSYEFGAIDIGIGSLIFLNIDGETVIEYPDVIAANVNALMNFSLFLYNDNDSKITIRPSETYMSMDEYNTQVSKNLYKSGKVLIDGIDSSYNAREEFVIIKSGADKVLTERKAVDVSAAPCLEIGGKTYIPASKAADILGAEVAESGNVYTIKYHDAETAITAEEINGTQMLPLEATLQALNRGFVEDETTGLFIVGNIVTMNNIKILTNLASLLDKLDELDDGVDFIYQ